MKYLLSSLLTVLFVIPVCAQVTSTSNDRTGLSLTIYNAGIGLVREARTLDLKKGVQSLIYKDVSEQIIPQTVSIKPANASDELVVFEQNYEYDLINQNRLLDKYVGKQVKLVTTHPTTGQETIVDAVLISNNGRPIYKVKDQIELNFPGRVTLPGIPDNLYERPTLIWKLASGASKSMPVEVTYQTNGMGWSADYVLILDAGESKMDVTSWVTLINDTETRFEKAELQLIAGEINRVVPPPPSAKSPEFLYEEVVFETRQDVGVPEFEQENLSEFYLYTLDQPTDINARQQKQVQLFQAGHVNVQKRFVFDNLQFYGDESNQNATIEYEFKNSKENELGRPLPAGTMRVFKTDSKGRTQLLGEDAIKHIPINEEVKLKTGQAFDILGKAQQMEFENFTIGRGDRSYYKVTLTNRKEEEVAIRVYVNLYGEWKLNRNNFNYQKESNNRIYFDVPVKADSKTDLFYQIEQHYK